MGVNMRNSEGYYDPTPYEALTNIEREAKAARAYRPLVYICSPLAGNVEQNQKNARRYCRFAVDSGYIPLAPHIYFTQFMSDRNPRERNLAMFHGSNPVRAFSMPKWRWFHAETTEASLFLSRLSQTD